MNYMRALRIMYQRRFMSKNLKLTQITITQNYTRLKRRVTLRSLHEWLQRTIALFCPVLYCFLNTLCFLIDKMAKPNKKATLF